MICYDICNYLEAIQAKGKLQSVDFANGFWIITDIYEIRRRKMLPKQFMDRMQRMLGEEYEEFVQSYEQDRYQALRLNPLKKRMTGENPKKDLEEKQEDWPEYVEKFQMTPVSWEGNGFYYSKEAQPGKHPLHEAGVYYIQEPSAMAVVPLLGVQPGEKILDLCAAPGGKSTQIAGYMQGQGLLISNEIHPARAKILSENVERMGVRNACVTNESPTRLSEKFPGYFDRILVDAPCSGEGMFRKNEEACGEWSPENVVLCADRQDQILDCAAHMLRPGGRLVYSTCTFAPAENEGSIYRFLKRHPEFMLCPIDKERMGLPEGQCDGRPEWAEGVMEKVTMAEGAVKKDFNGELEKTLRLWPHVVKGEGHFAAVLQKEANMETEYETFSVGGLEPGCSGKDKELSLWWDFWKETGRPESDFHEVLTQGIFLRFGEELYLAPRNLPALKGLKVLRPGLHLGTLKKNRFEPSHGLALVLSGNDVRHVYQFKASDTVVADYLKGQTFSYDGEKGWYLIVIDGYSLGWGKLAGGIMKNHYPKGLRRM